MVSILFPLFFVLFSIIMTAASDFNLVPHSSFFGVIGIIAIVIFIALYYKFESGALAGEHIGKSSLLLLAIICLNLITGLIYSILGHELVSSIFAKYLNRDFGGDMSGLGAIVLPLINSGLALLSGVIVLVVKSFKKAKNSQ